MSQGIQPAEARLSKKKNVIGCFLAQGLKELRHSLTVLDFAIEHITDPVKVTGNFSPEEKVEMTRKMQTEGSSREVAIKLAKKFKRVQIRSIHAWFQNNKTTQSLKSPTKGAAAAAPAPSPVTPAPGDLNRARFIPEEQRNLILKVFQLNPGADIHSLTCNKPLTKATIFRLAPIMNRPYNTLLQHWNQILVPTILAQMNNRLHIRPEIDLLKAVIDQRVKDAVDYQSLVRDMPWHTPDSAKYILELCLAKCVTVGYKRTHEKASEVLYSHYLSKTMSKTTSERRWAIAEAYEEAMREYNPRA